MVLIPFLLARGSIFFFFFFFLLSAVLGLYRCLGFSLVAESRGYSLVAVLRLLVALASLVVELRL